MSKNINQSETKTEFKQHSDFTFNIKQDTTKLDNIIDNIETSQDIDIENYIDPKKLKKLQNEYIKQLQENKKKTQNIQTQTTESGKTIKSAETIGGIRTSRKETKSNAMKEIEKEAKEQGINQKELMQRIKTTISLLEEEAKKLEESEEFNQPIKQLSEDEINESREFLFNTYIYSENNTSNFINERGISTDKYISEITGEKYTTTMQPKENMIDSTPRQLVYISRLSKQLNTQLLQESNIQLSFNNIDKLLCNYFKNNKINDYKNVYVILREFFKKLIIVSLSDVELAFRSQNNWISPEFKKLILADVVMLQTLPPKLSKSWKIFIEELCKTNDANIFNDISKLDYIIHINDDFIIEETLAKSIKCMTPCFIYNYYLIVKNMYLLCGLLDDWFDKIRINKVLNKDELYKQLNNIIKVCLYLYENSRLHENSTARSLPYSKDPISQELQVYYLNHTITGPQYKLFKCLEKKILALI